MRKRGPEKIFLSNILVIQKIPFTFAPIKRTFFEHLSVFTPTNYISVN